MTEVWKDIAGYENEYQVSNLGNVRSLDRYVEYSDGRIHICKGQLMKLLEGGGGPCEAYGRGQEEGVFFGG